MLRYLAAGFLLICGTQSTLGAEKFAGQVVDAKYYHLGDSVVTNWNETTTHPIGKRLDLTFNSHANTSETLLSIGHRHIDGKWELTLNGKLIGHLHKEQTLRQFYYTVPPNILINGTNVLSIISKSSTDDISIGNIKFFDQPLAKVLQLGRVQITVKEALNKKGLPVRLTILGEDKKLVPIYEPNSPNLAVREGLVYTSTGVAEFSLPAGNYSVIATRGMEWSRREVVCKVTEGKKTNAHLELRHEVDTRGFIACDTHLHTLTFSGHGDSTLTERIVTIAGEGVELAISTDHNHHTDYAPEQKKLSLNKYFTPMVGNEVTTKNGHFNAFPLSPKKPVPNYKETNWVKLAANIREHGAKVIIMNHPRWPSPKDNPLNIVQFNQASGDRTDDVALPVDGIELANSTSLQKDPLLLFRDWFALLNHGNLIKAVGSSDSHTVGDPVGQGRTYIRSSTDDPSQIDTNEVIRYFLRGATSISMGIFSDIKVDGKFRPGDLVKVGSTVGIQFRVASPSWISPRRALLFVNGQLVEEKSISILPSQPTDQWISFKIKKPRHDAYVVCLALGDGVTDESWKTYENYTLSATNPVWLDANGDGKFTTPRETAQHLLLSMEQKVTSLRSIAQTAEPGIAVQAMSLARAQWPSSTLGALGLLLDELATTTPAFALYRDQLRGR